MDEKDHPAGVDNVLLERSRFVFLARVTGDVVATLKHRALEGRRLLWLERIDPDGRGLGGMRIGIDNVDAGFGDLVLVLDEGNGAAQVLARPRGPIRTVIVGVVDASCLDPC